MSPLELRQRLHAELDQIPEVELPKVQQYFTELAIPTTHATLMTVATGSSLLAALKSMGAWQGDDLQDCLQAVYDSRSPAKFGDDEPNPFD
jgi:hypothetical protein